MSAPTAPRGESVTLGVIPMTWQRASILGLVAILPLSEHPRAQQATFSAGNRTVAVYATVTDAGGRLVPDLGRDDFQIDDNGKRQELTLFANEIQPITVVMLLDRSAQHARNFELVEKAAEQFVAVMLPADKARIGSFSNRIQVDPRDFTSDHDELLKILRTELQEEGPTPLWNAVNVGITALLHQQGRRVVLVFTDGVDEPMNFSNNNSSLKDVMKRAEEENVMVYAIGLAGSGGRSYGGGPGGGFGGPGGGGRGGRGGFGGRGGGRGGFGRGGYGGGGYGGGSRPSPTNRTKVSRRLPRRPAAAISSSRPQTISRPPSRASPTSCIISTRSGSRRRRSTARCTRCRCASRNRRCPRARARAISPRLHARRRPRFMNISEIFIRRPIATSLLMAAIAMFGLLAYRELPVSNLPDVDFPTISVSASLPGGDPVTMSSAVASPLERQFTTIAGIDSMTSSSSLGSSTVTMQFDLSRDIDSATIDVQTAIAAVMPLLPAGMPAPPSFKKVNPADEPFLHLALTSRTVPLWVLDDYAETLIAPGVSMVSGVAQVQVGGATKYAVRVQVDPEKLHAEHIGLSEVDAALQNWNVNLPTGQLFGANATLQHSGRRSAHERRGVPAAGRRVPSRRAGPPRSDRERHRRRRRLQEHDLAVHEAERRAGDQARRAAAARHERHRRSSTRFAGCSRRSSGSCRRRSTCWSAAITRRTSARRSAKSRLTMAITLVLVVGVIFLFLHNGSATLIPALALPFSILGTFAVMKLLHFSLDNLSMMALILSVGFVVDDAIVMLENIVRHLESRRGAAGGGAQRIEGDLLHDRVDDRLARGRVHPDPVHGRRSWGSCSASSPSRS